MIEQKTNINPDDILNLKQILTLLGFTTMQSISKLSSNAELQKIQLEFLKMKETEGFKIKYPNLCGEIFGIGMATNINIIANQIKKGHFFENFDENTALEQVFADCKKVFV